MDWQAIGVLVSLCIAVASAAYTFGVVSTRLHDQNEEIKRVRDRLDRFVDKDITWPK